MRVPYESYMYVSKSCIYNLAKKTAYICMVYTVMIKTNDVMIQHTLSLKNVSKM